MKFLLSVIALCLVMITAKLYIPEAQAKVGGINKNQLINDRDFKEAVNRYKGVILHFKTGAFNRSAISPFLWIKHFKDFYK